MPVVMSSSSQRFNAVRRVPVLPHRTRFAATALQLGLALTAVPALAASPFEGRYQGRGDGRLDLQVFELGDGSGTHFVMAGTAIPDQCTGELRGLAKPAGAGALALTRKESGSDETCALTLRFGPDRKRVRMEVTLTQRTGPR